MDGEGHPEGDEDVRDVEAGVKVGADGERHRERGVEAAAIRGVRGADCGEESDAERVDGEEESEDAEGEWEARGPVVDAEDVHPAGGEPVHEGRLVEETDAVDEGRDVVVALHHLAGDLDVDGVDVVEQAGGEDAAEVEDEPGEVMRPSEDHRQERGGTAPTTTEAEGFGTAVVDVTRGVSLWSHGDGLSTQRTRW